MAETPKFDLPWPLDVLVLNPSFSRWAGYVVGALSALGFFIMLTKSLNYPSSPQFFSVAEILAEVPEAETWVSLKAGKFNCETAELNQKNAHYALTPVDSDQPGVVVVTFDQPRECEYVSGLSEVSGIIEKTSDRAIEHNKISGLVSKDVKGPFLSLCTYCGATNAIFGLVAFGFMSIVGIFLGSLVNILRKYYGMT